MSILARRLRLFLLLSIGVFGNFACSSEPDADETRAVLIGIDSADWKVIDRLMADGKMPNFQRLQEMGIRAPIETLTDVPLSPVIWTSVATGKSLTKHGISWFMVDQPDGTRAPVQSGNRQCEAIWNILAENDRIPSVLGWWATFPAERVGSGRIVSDALGFHGFGATGRGFGDDRKTYPSALFEPVNALMPTLQQIGPDFACRFFDMTPEEYRKHMFLPSRRPHPDPGNEIHLFQQYAVTAQGYTAIAEQLIEDDFDLFMVYFEQVDSLSHLFMKYAPPRLDWIDPAEYERYQNVVERWYAYQDELLGRLLDKIDLETTAVVVVADHGFKSGDRRIRSEQAVDVRKAHLDHEPYGVFLAAGPQIRKGERFEGASVLDVTPTLLHYLGLAVAKDMDGRVLTEVFEPTFLEDNPIRYRSTYEGQRRGGDVVRYDGDQGDALMQNLSRLGYAGRNDLNGGGPANTETKEGSSSPEIHNNLGRTHLRNGDVDQALVEFEKALKLDANNADALLNIGSIKRFQGRTAEAEYFVKRALQVDPNSIGALCELAEIQRDLNKLGESIRLYKEALSIDDSQPFVYLGLGDSLQRAGESEEAEAAFIRVLELEPDSFEARYNLGVTYSNRGDLAKAAEQYEKALEKNPDHPSASLALNNIADLLLRQGDVNGAIKRFEEAVEKSPLHFESRYNLAIQYAQRNRIDEAVTLLEEASKLQPNHEMCNAQLGFLYVQKGRYDDAYRCFTLVRRLFPNNWGASIGLALLHAASETDVEGNRTKAKSFLEDALRTGGRAAHEEAERHAILVPLLEEVEGK